MIFPQYLFISYYWWSTSWWTDPITTCTEQELTLAAERSIAIDYFPEPLPNERDTPTDVGLVSQFRRIISLHCMIEAGSSLSPYIYTSRERFFPGSWWSVSPVIAQVLGQQCVEFVYMCVLCMCVCVRSVYVLCVCISVCVLEIAVFKSLSIQYGEYTIEY